MRWLIILAVVAAFGGEARAQSGEAVRVQALIRDLESRDFDRAHAAAERLRDHPAFRAQSVPALIQAVTTREWNRCSADVRDAAALTLAVLKAPEAVGPLLDLVKSGKSIDHECFE
jgi:HEAT repeat protein